MVAWGRLPQSQVRPLMVLAWKPVQLPAQLQAPPKPWAPPMKAGKEPPSPRKPALWSLELAMTASVQALLRACRLVPLLAKAEWHCHADALHSCAWQAWGQERARAAVHVLHAQQVFLLGRAADQIRWLLQGRRWSSPCGGRVQGLAPPVQDRVSWASCNQKCNHLAGTAEHQAAQSEGPSIVMLKHT